MSLEQRARQIETMEVRGAGAIARHAASSLSAWAREEWTGDDGAAFHAAFRDAVGRLRATRPTAVSLGNALSFVERRVDAVAAADVPRQRAVLDAAAEEFVRRSEAAVADVGVTGAAFIEDGGTYLTHCNSQAAVGVFRAAWDAGKRFRVLASETRPWRQGLLTARDLRAAGIEDVALIVDAAVHRFMEDVDGVVVGADTVALDGDVVNKIGTSMVALSAKNHGVPFHVAAETYKVDLAARTGRGVAIEERSSAEVVGDGELAEGVRILNPVFDVTPADHITRILTEQGAVASHEVGALAKKSWQ